MCLFPKIIHNPKYKPNKKNGGNIPPVNDYRILGVPIGCGKCIECVKQKSREWQIRLSEDIKTHTNAKFVTLTFSNEQYKKLYNETLQCKTNPYERDNIIATMAVRRFTERWRKATKRSIRHWLVTELGHTGTEHIHLHGLLFTDENRETISQRWMYGYTWTGTYVNGKTINYITKYIAKQDADHKYYKPKILTSAGIGRNYTTSKKRHDHIYKNTETKDYYKNDSGHKQQMPIYWRNKLFTDEQKEQLWIQKLDKNTRWICGDKIDLNEKTEQEYYDTLEWHRKRNKKLGYGDDKINWTRKKYEDERRAYLQKEKIKTPSAGSISKGFGLNKRPHTNVDTSDVERRNKQILKRSGVAPAVGCERLHQILDRTIPQLYWDTKKQIWKINTNRLPLKFTIKN